MENPPNPLAQDILAGMLEKSSGDCQTMQCLAEMVSEDEIATRLARAAQVFKTMAGEVRKKQGPEPVKSGALRVTGR